jgi:glycosidase
MRIVNFPTYNFFYRVQENGTTIEKDFESVTYFDAKDTPQYKVLEQLQRRGIITAFGWTTIFPYSPSNN